MPYCHKSLVPILQAPSVPLNAAMPGLEVRILLAPIAFAQKEK